MLAASLAGAGGCASSRWVDERVPGDLWGTAGTELRAVELLGKAPPERAARGDASERDADELQGAFDAMIELVLLGLAVW